jgi:hypothetical protein
LQLGPFNIDLYTIIILLSNVNLLNIKEELKSQAYLCRWEYDIIAGDKVEVCLGTYMDDSMNDLLHMAEAYLSLILNVVSVLLLFLTVLTYALFPELRNLPGCNLMCLAISTLVSQVMNSKHIL